MTSISAANTGPTRRVAADAGIAVALTSQQYHPLDASQPAAQQGRILMRAVTLDSFDAAPVVRDDLPDPRAVAGGLVVRVRASSVNPVDNAIAAGMLREMVEHDFPVVLGRDYAGTVEAIGSDVEGYAVGDEVFGFLLHANPTV